MTPSQVEANMLSELETIMQGLALSNSDAQEMLDEAIGYVSSARVYIEEQSKLEKETKSNG